MKLSFSSIFLYVMRYLELQLFITLASLPILIAWGLPVSILSFLGNFVFNPFLALFLFFSSLIFFCEIVGIPNQWLIECLIVQTHWWQKILSLAHNSTLIGLPAIGLLGFCIPTLAAFYVLHHRSLISKKYVISAFTIIFLCYCSYLKFNAITDDFRTLNCNSGPVTIIRSQGKTVLLDNGSLNKKSSNESWAEYALLSDLNRLYGTATIDYAIFLKTSKNIFPIIRILCLSTPVKGIYMLYNPQFDDAYKALEKDLKEKNSSLFLLHKSQEITISKNTQIIIELLSTKHDTMIATILHHNVKYCI